EIRYLLTVPGDAELAGDLRVLERLIEKEQHAHKNLGDVAWLLQLYDAEKEEEEIARGIERHDSPESIIPDEPQAEEAHWLDFLLNDGDAEPPASEGKLPALFSDDRA
ncbi:MAG TPA: hypothetical protein VEB21_07940, partial [Terriglobales bacterium]|nr:hypothetical protein [Terriglobales bacterium]